MEISENWPHKRFFYDFQSQSRADAVKEPFFVLNFTKIRQRCRLAPARRAGPLTALF